MVQAPVDVMAMNVIPRESEQTMSHSFSKNVMRKSACGKATDLKVLSANIRSIIGPYSDFNSCAKAFLKR